jgi:hypothetical protein
MVRVYISISLWMIRPPRVCPMPSPCLGGSYKSSRVSLIIVSRGCWALIRCLYIYIYIYVYIHICTYTYAHLFICTYTNVHIWIYIMYVFKSIADYSIPRMLGFDKVYIYVHIHIYTCTYAQLSICMHIYVHLWIYIMCVFKSIADYSIPRMLGFDKVYIYVDIHINTCTYAQLSICMHIYVHLWIYIIYLFSKVSLITVFQECYALIRCI